MERFRRAAHALGINVPTGAGRTFNYIIAWTIIVATTFLPSGPVFAIGTLTNAKVGLSDSRPSHASTNYVFSGSGVTTSPIKCIKLVFATDATGTTVPTGFNSNTSAALNAAGTNYVPTPASWGLNKTTNGTLLITLAGGETPDGATGRTVSIDGITNSSVVDTQYFLRISTFNNIDCATSPVDSSSVEFINTNGSAMSLSIDPTLSFTVSGMGSSLSCDGATTTGTSTGTTIPFGTVTFAANQVVCQDLLASTNASTGYSVYMRYTGAPQSGTSTIDPHTGSNAAPTAFSAPGTESYGYSTDDASLGTAATDRFTSPSQGWAAATTTNAEVGFESTPITATHYHVGHQVGISSITPAGTYQTTIIYTCTPVY